MKTTLHILQKYIKVASKNDYSLEKYKFSRLIFDVAETEKKKKNKEREKIINELPLKTVYRLRRLRNSCVVPNSLRAQRKERKFTQSVLQRKP